MSKDLLAFHQSLLQNLELKRLGAEEPAGIWLSSLPLPRQAPQSYSLGGQSTAVLPIGQWYDVQAKAPRRLLLAADGGNQAPATLSLKANKTKDSAPGIKADKVCFEQSQEEGYKWERHYLRLEFKGRKFGLAMGLRHAGQTNWWEACRLQVMRRLPFCTEIEMGGTIPVEHYGRSALAAQPGYQMKYLHLHNWLNGKVYARLYDNGVIEVYAHHINSKYVDDGREFEDLVPVIGLVTEDAASQDQAKALVGPWDGSRTQLTLGDAALDIRDIAPLATPTQPGAFHAHPQFLVFQPYLGSQLYGGICAKDRLGDGYIYRSDKQQWPRGMARTLRFTVSLNPERAPVVKRYQAPAWWYGHCEELQARSVLPVNGPFDELLERFQSWLKTTTVWGGFDDGCAARGAKEGLPPPHEPSWEGEVPYAQFLMAWRTGCPEQYDRAMRVVYFFTDVCIDHAVKLVRMHGYPPPAVALPMMRLLGTIAAYLENGDPYLLETARGVADTSIWLNKNSWPRMTVGRDACFIRGPIMLYRYFGDQHYRELGREAVQHVIESQRANGSFGDQGGGTGIHQWSAYITKPWMACMALGPVADYLELHPEDEGCRECLRKLGEWLLHNRFDWGGWRSWAYQHEYDGQPKHFNFLRAEWLELPGKASWRGNYLARLLPLASIVHGDARYFDAFMESYTGRPQGAGGDHGFAQSGQYITWLQDRLWSARLTPDGISAEPWHFGPRTPTMGIIQTPAGDLPARWDHGQARIGQQTFAGQKLVVPPEGTPPALRRIEGPAGE